MSEALSERAAGKAARKDQKKRRKAEVAALRADAPAARNKNRAGGISKKSREELASAVAIQRWRGVALGVLLLAGCVVFGVQVASQAQQMRALYSELQRDQAAKDALLAERSRLLLERGALKSYSQAEKLARETLGMRFPESITRVEVSR